MRIKQLSQILDQGNGRKDTVSDADRFNEIVRMVLKEYPKQGTPEQVAKDRELLNKQVSESLQGHHQVSFAEMVNKYL
jgi:hypothetical protein